MDLKTIVDDPETAIRRRWGSCAASEEKKSVYRSLAALKDLKAAIKEAKEEKGQLSGRFREAKGNRALFLELKREMARVSERLTDLGQERKDQETRLLALFDETETRPPFPERFRASVTPDTTIPDRLDVALVEDRDGPDWDAYVTAREQASLYHLFAWKQVVEQAFHHDCYYFAARDGRGKIRGVLPLVSLTSRLFGRYAVSLPFFNYGGPLGDNPAVVSALLEGARREARRRNWEHIEYRSWETGINLPSTSRKASLILKLPASSGELDAALRAKVRAQCKQAQRRRPHITFGGGELLDDFYAVFARNMRDLGTPVYGKRFFESMLEVLPNHCTLVSVALEGKPAGAAFLLGYKDMLEIPWASTLREHNDCNLNMWMYRRILDYGIQAGYGYFDFGRSTENAGTYKFKKQWGAQPLTHHWYYQMMPAPSTESSLAATENQPQELPALNPDNPKFRLAIAAWKRLPLFVANALGPHIVKNLP